MKHFLQIIIISLTLTGISESGAQSWTFSSTNKKAIKYYKQAETAFKSSDYLLVREQLLKAIKKDDKFIEAWLLLGDVNNELGRKEKAITSFKEAIRIDPAFFPKAYFFLGNLSYELGRYENSAGYFREYLRFEGEQDFTRFLARKRLKRSMFADSLVHHPLQNVPVGLGKPVNSVSDEYINFINETLTRLFLTRKIATDTGRQGQQIFAERFFESEAGSSGWKIPAPMELDWLEGLNAGGMNLSVDGRKMYFTGCNWVSGYGSCDLFVSSRLGTRWEAPVNLGPTINSQWWDSQPVVSPDGNRIFFSSKRAGGKGGSDIWMTIRLKHGKWSSPVNLGDSINTADNEMAPFLHADGNTLYFSSDGHDGLGGADLFITRKNATGQWGKAINLGYPINSRYNEINIFVGLDGEFAYLSSDKPGGEGGFDIYQIRVDSIIAPGKVYFVKGIVRDKSTGKPLQASVSLTNLVNGLEVQQSQSDAQTGEFLVVLNNDIEYAFNITKPGYLLYSENLDLTKPVASSTEKIFEIEPIVAGTSLVLENVFFEFEQATLNPKSYAELNRLIELLNENPDIRILIGGHTDTVGGAEYNLRLSEDRAAVVHRYLIDQGVDAGRLQYKGYGAEKPIADNNTEAGRAINRRTEVVVVEE